METYKVDPQTYLNPNNFEVEVLNYREQSSNELQTIYTIKVQYKEQEPWKVSRTFNEFESLHQKLVRLFREVPILPSRSIFAISDREKENRMKQLESYLNMCLKEPSILCSEALIEFVEMNTRLSVYPNPPYKLYDMDNCEFPILKSILIKSRSLMVHVTGPKVSDGLVNGVLNKMSWLLLGAGSINMPTADQVGTIIVMKEVDNESNIYSVLSVIELKDAPTSASFDNKSSILSIGYASGLIECFVLTPESNKFKLFTSMRTHKKRIIGLQGLGIKSSLISISQDNMMLAHDISSEESFKQDEILLNNQLTCLDYDPVTDNIFVGTAKGEFYVYSFGDGKFTLEAKVIGGQESEIVHFYIEPARNYMFVGYKNGVIYVYEVMGKMSNPRDFKHVTCYEIKNQPTCMALHTKNRLLFVSDNCGLLNLIDIKSSETIMVVEMMREAINSIELFCNDTMLIVSGDSKACGVYKLPAQYFIDDLPLQKQIIAKKTKIVIEAQKQAAVDKMEERVKNSQQTSKPPGSKTLSGALLKPDFESESSEEFDSDEDIVIKKKKLAANKYGGKREGPVVQNPLPISTPAGEDSDEDTVVRHKPTPVIEDRPIPRPEPKPQLAPAKKKVFVGGNSSDSDDSDDN